MAVILKINKIGLILIAMFTMGSCQINEESDKSHEELVEESFKTPSSHYGISCFWWWLNGNVTKASITSDLEAMKEKGFNGALIFDAGGQNQQGNGNVPEGPMFGSAEWQLLFQHAVKEAHRLGLKLGLSIQSGWNLGGPDVQPQEASKLLTWSEITASDNDMSTIKLPTPKHRDDFYQDIAVLAIPFHSANVDLMPVSDLNLKIAAQEAAFSATDMRPIFLKDKNKEDGRAHANSKEVIDLTDKLNDKGELEWTIPAGKWTIMRFGYTTNGAHVSTASGRWNGLVIDYMSKKHFLHYWNRHVRPLLLSIDTLAGTTLNYLHTDSWELGGANWTENFRDEFRSRRNYDLLSFLPVVAGKIINSREESNRFLADFRKTISDCIADNHYGFFAQKAHEFGVGIHPESGGPHAGPFDGLKNYGRSDLIMSEFWSPSGHRPTPERRFFVKQAASAAHIYGKKLVAAEGFTTIGHHWDDVIWKDMKPSFDHEVCAGLNKTYLHTLTNSPKEMGLPGQEYFAGTHFNPNITWWKFANVFFDYISRVQYMMQDGQFVADVLYYYGDHVPNIATLKSSDPAGALPDFDYDVINEERLLQLETTKEWVQLPQGNKYRVLVLPDHAILSVEALKKINLLVQNGATIIGPKTQKTMSMMTYPSSETEVSQIADTLWGYTKAPRGSKKVGKGLMVWGYSASEWLMQNGIKPDCHFVRRNDSLNFDYIHHNRNGEDDYYFLSNQNRQAVATDVAFRITGKLPEFWNAETGEIMEAKAFKQENGMTTVPITFKPYGSWFVVFRKDIPTNQQGGEATNFERYEEVDTLSGAWEVAFKSAFGESANVTFPHLISWTEHTDRNIKYYSGSALYKKSFTLKDASSQLLYLDLGKVEDVGIAKVSLNGKELAVLWSPPYRLKLSGVKIGQNDLEVEVVNSWRNRLIGDKGLPKEQRLTQTNITVRDDWKLITSGLIGPVTLQRAQSE